MHLAKLTIEGFRKIHNIEIHCRPGLNVFVGPNNVGKTAIVDALRALLSTSTEGFLRLDEHDFHIDAAGVKASEITFRYVFGGLTEAEEADFLAALKPMQDASPQYEAHITVRYSEADAGGRLRVRRWCGDYEEHALTADMLEALTAVYLPPLRDPASGLRPSRTSQLARLAVRLSDDVARTDVEETLKKLDSELSAKPPVSRTEKAVTTSHESMLGAELKQVLKVGLAPADFFRIAARLSLSVENLDIEQNGLGYNNLIYMAVVLSELSTDSASPYKALIVEEPEAHLHPQLQAVLLEYLQSKETPGAGERAVQVFVTSHSPNFASVANIDTIGCLHSSGGVVKAFFPRTVQFDKTKKEKLQRYLDVTRAELFFARRIVLVEGAAELFIVNALARRIGIDLRRSAVSVLSTQGLNFDAFLPLFGDDALSARVAIISDADPGADVYPLLNDPFIYSDAAKKLLACASNCVQVFFARKTLEYDLALHEENRVAMLRALEDIHPNIAKDLRLSVKGAAEGAKAKQLFCGMFEREQGKASVQKGAFGQALAQVLLVPDVTCQVPEYISSALKFVTA